MNHFYCNLDARLEKFQVIERTRKTKRCEDVENFIPIIDQIQLFCQVYNVHTMKDEFMIVSGMPERNGDRHVSEIASMALDLLAGLEFRKNIKVFFTRYDICH